MALYKTDAEGNLVRVAGFGKTDNFFTTNTEQTVTAKKTIANSAQILNEDGQNVLNQTDLVYQVNNILKLLELYSNGRPYVNDGSTRDYLAYLGDLAPFIEEDSRGSGGSSGTSWYIKFSNGVMLQWGLGQAGGGTGRTVTFAQPFINTSYGIVGNMMRSGSTANGWNYVETRSTTGTRFICGDDQSLWVAMGYWK